MLRESRKGEGLAQISLPSLLKQAIAPVRKDPLAKLHSFQLQLDWRQSI